MTWQENLFSNLLVVFILIVLGAITYCKMTNTTLKELILSIREAMSEPIENE